MADEQAQDTPQTIPEAPVAKPDPAVTVVAATAPTAPRPEPVTVTPEQVARWKAIEADNLALTAAELKRQQEAQEAEEKRLVEQGQLKEVIANKERLIAERDKKARENDARFRKTTLEGQLAFALSDHQLTEGSPDQLLRLLRDDLEVVEDGDTWKVQSRDGRPVKQYVAETLGHKDYAKYVRATTAGGGPKSNAGNAPPPKTPERPNVEQRQVDSLKVAFAANPANRLAGFAGTN